jgi:serine protease Do
MFQPDPSPVLLRTFGAESGVVVTGIQPGGPAEKAGLKQGDVIVAIGGKPVEDGDSLIAVVASSPVGQPVAVKYIRDKREQETSVVIGDRTEVFAGTLNPGRGSDNPSQGEAEEAKFGISIQNITPEIASRLGIEANQGVLVTSVDNGSFAEEIGLQRGDVIQQLNHQPVSRVDDVLRIQRGLPSGSDVVFMVRRAQGQQSTTLYLAGTLP